MLIAHRETKGYLLYCAISLPATFFFRKIISQKLESRSETTEPSEMPIPLTTMLRLQVFR